MASVHQHPKSRFWQAAFETWIADENHPDGGSFVRRQISTGIPVDHDKRDALAVAAQWEAVGRGLAPENARRHSRKFYMDALNGMFRAAGVEPQRIELTWREYSGTWLREKQEEVSHHSHVKYVATCEAFADWLGGRADDTLSLIRHDDVQRFYDDVLASGRAPRTCSAYIKVISSVMERAHVLGYIENNPARLIKKVGAAARKFERLPFSREEIAQIFAWLRESGREDWLTACLFGLHFGWRLKDATERRVADIELKDGVPTSIKIKPSKKQKIIRLPIVGSLQSHLVELLPKREDLLCPSIAGNRKLSQIFNGIIDAVGVPYETVKASGPKGNALRTKSFHSWRHTSKTLLIGAGVSARVADLINNHDDPKVAMAYTHAEIETMAEAIRLAIP